MATLSIIIVNYNVKHYIAQCLDSIFRSSYVDFDVIVVDNHSHDGSVEYIKRKYPMVKVIALNHNLGFARANNIALRQTQSKYALLLNPDTVVGEESIEQSVRFMESHDKCGGLGLQMLNADGSKAMESRRGLPTPLTSFYKMIGLCKLCPKHASFGRYYLGFLPWDQPVQIEIVSGAYFMLRKEALDKIGLLDEDFFMYGEDIDLGYRILKGGYQNWYIPATILHYKGESTHKSSFRYVHVFYEAMLIFLRKHYGHLSILLSVPIKVAILLKAFVALVAMQMGVLRKNLGFVDNEHREDPLYVFFGSESAVSSFKSLAESKGLRAKCIVATSASCPSGHLSTDNATFDSDATNYAVYDMASYAYSDVLRIFSAAPRDNVLMAFYHPKDNIIITSQDILK